MRLSYTCSACKKLNYIKHKASTRPDLQVKLGTDDIKVDCENCGKMDKKHLNQITTVVDNRIVLLGLLIGLILTLVFWNTYRAISTASLIIPLLFWISENKALSGFNKFLIKRK
ncbi:hypothetical protein Murru_1423 [Allomuricauda ruestringensis DSM 13258]|uniref:Uncharacterized protein n=1 Tax=Allomuricauda ruestringensis (strain DSM 13258 / CIP 107369 / LMG 19739 / B1) TaxID=886377 RepID=G2PPZ9_ALLRU|nr:hypothetical protein Murru_1423 [Allomuricauda ruestringensis DSM 13258]